MWKLPNVSICRSFLLDWVSPEESPYLLPGVIILAVGILGAQGWGWGGVISMNFLLNPHSQLHAHHFPQLCMVLSQDALRFNFSQDKTSSFVRRRGAVASLCRVWLGMEMGEGEEVSLTHCFQGCYTASTLRSKRCFQAQYFRDLQCLHSCWLFLP